MTEANLISSFDARDWAKEFVAIAKENPSIALDEGAMIGWFANALMCGYDTHARKLELESKIYV